MQDSDVEDKVRLAQTEIAALNDEDLETIAEFLVHLREEEVHLIAEVVKGDSKDDHSSK